MVQNGFVYIYVNILGLEGCVWHGRYLRNRPPQAQLLVLLLFKLQMKVTLIHLPCAIYPSTRPHNLLNPI